MSGAHINLGRLVLTARLLRRRGFPAAAFGTWVWEVCRSQHADQILDPADIPEREIREELVVQDVARASLTEVPAIMHGRLDRGFLCLHSRLE